MKNIQKLTAFLSQKKEGILLFSLMLLSGITHAYNMFHFPYFENDEGTYMSQAWSLVTSGQLQPYTYWYDHAPAGWMFIALWTMLTGGFFTFGTSVESGRVFMLLLHLGSTFFLYKIAKKISGKSSVGVIAVLFFALSPLAIYYQRRVLLDNIMTFWSLLSLFLLTNTESKLRYIAASAAALGIAVLSKENAIFFAPAFLYVIYTKFHKYHKNFALFLFSAISALIISLYFIYAFLKNEFFPVGFLGNMSPHVSLLTTLHDQVSRGSNLPFWNQNSDFYFSLQTWLFKDPFIIIIGAFTSLATILVSVKIKRFRLPALLVGSFWLFLLRGKLVIDFYIIPLIPLLGLAIGLTTQLLIEKLTTNAKKLYLPLMLFALITFSSYYAFHQIGQYTHDETTPQIQAISWIQKNLPADSNIVIDDYMYVDLHAAKNPTDPVFTNAQWAWKIEKDPAITLSQTDSDWNKTIYIALSHEIVKQIKSGNFTFIKEALLNSTRIEDWYGGYAFRNIPQFISTDGDWISIYKVKNRFSIMLDNAWNYYKGAFIHSYGQVIDPKTAMSTSEGQSYAMMRSVLENDRQTYDGVWAWTHDHLQYRTQDKLFSWQYVKKGNTYVEGDTASATDADEDVALSLLLAYNKWHDTKYLKDAKPIISDIFKQEVKQVNGDYYVVSGTSSEQSTGYLVNPSYLAPATYRLFAIYDPKDPWTKVATDSYALLNKLSGNTNQLPPNWILVHTGTGEVTSAAPYISDQYRNDYGYDAFRVFYRVALDARWNNSSSAKVYLNRYKPFFEKQLQTGDYKAILTPSGTDAVTYQSLSTLTGAYFVLAITDPSTAQKLYKEQIESQNSLQNGYWADKTNYYDQNWAWFATYIASGFPMK